MAAKKKQIEDQIEEDDELEEVQDEDSLEEDEKEEKQEEKKEESEEDSVTETEESSESEEKEGEKEEDREAIRERRRREKKMKRERDRREKAMLQQTIVTMAEEIKKLQNRTEDNSKRFEGLTQNQIDNEVKELGTIYNQAQAAMEAAIADGDGKKFTQAKAISDKAWARYTFLETQKRQRPDSATSDKHSENLREGSSHKEKDESQDDASDKVILGDRGKRFGINFLNKHKSWYDPNGGNRESKIVQTIDADLYNEGYDPETKEYWDELEDRCKEVLPKRFSNGQKSQKSIVGGSGDYSSPNSSEKSLPKEFVQTLKAAGYWEDPVKRKAAIKNYYAQKKGA